MSTPTQRHAVIYVPGLGDSRIAGQSLAVKLWRLQKVEPYLFQVNWSDGGHFSGKMDSLLELVDKLVDEGKTVSLVGASAGGSFVINAYARRKNTIHAVVGICGKLQAHGLDSVHGAYYRRNPAFLESMRTLQASENALDNPHRARILSLHPTFDESVPVSETKLPGVRSAVMPVAGHFFGIAYGLTIGSFKALRFVKSLARQGGR